MWSFKLHPIILIGMTPLCLGGIFKVDFTTAILGCCSQFLVKVKNEPSLCMHNCLSESQQYDQDHLFWMSMPNAISVSGNL